MGDSRLRRKCICWYPSKLIIMPPVHESFILNDTLRL